VALAGLFGITAQFLNGMEKGARVKLIIDLNRLYRIDPRHARRNSADETVAADS
jgi:hypothetical protein